MTRSNRLCNAFALNTNNKSVIKGFEIITCREMNDYQGGTMIQELKTAEDFLDTDEFGLDDPFYRVFAVYKKDYFRNTDVLIVDDIKDAQMIVEVRSGANSQDNSTATLGISEDQSLPNPVTGAPIALPEIAFYKKENNYAATKIAIIAYQAKSREHIFSSGTLLGGA